MASVPPARTRRREHAAMAIAGMNVLLGGAVAGVGVVVADGLMAWNAVTVGSLVVVLALFNAWVALHHESHRGVSPAAASLVLGLWFALSPFVLPVAHFSVLYTAVVLGLLVAVLAAYNAWAGHRHRYAGPHVA